MIFTSQLFYITTDDIYTRRYLHQRLIIILFSNNNKNIFKSNRNEQCLIDDFTI